MSYGYDAANRLTGWTAPGAAASYRYDGDGLRTGGTHTVGTTTTTDSSTWDTGTLGGGLPVLLADATSDYLYGPAGTPLAQITRATGAVTSPGTTTSASSPPMGARSSGPPSSGTPRSRTSQARSSPKPSLRSTCTCSSSRPGP